MRQGMTIAELLIVIAIMVILLVVTTPLYSHLQVSVRLNEETVQVIQALRLARERSVTGYKNSAHGVYLETNASTADRYIVYQGPSYALRDTSYDRSLELSGQITFTFTDLTLINGDDVDINFSSGLGVPDNVGTITLNHNSSQSRSIVINSLGLIEKN